MEAVDGTETVVLKNIGVIVVSGADLDEVVPAGSEQGMRGIKDKGGPVQYGFRIKWWGLKGNLIGAESLDFFPKGNGILDRENSKVICLPVEDDVLRISGQDFINWRDNKGWLEFFEKNDLAGGVGDLFALGEFVSCNADFVHALRKKSIAAK